MGARLSPGTDADQVADGNTIGGHNPLCVWVNELMDGRFTILLNNVNLDALFSCLSDSTRNAHKSTWAASGGFLCAQHQWVA